MSDEKERKASDILLSIENKIDLLFKICQNHDFTNKLILTNTNKILALIDPNKEEKEQESYVSQQPIIEVEKNPKGVRRTSRTPEAIKFDVSEEIKESNTPNLQGKISKVAVIQRVTDQTNKDLFMANVTILDKNDNQISKIKTNAVGKWQAHLSPGEYKINIDKVDSASKKKLESSQVIIVDGSSDNLKLPNHVIKK